MKEEFRTMSAIWMSNEPNLDKYPKMVVDFLLELRKHNSEVFSTWYEKGRSKKKALEKKVNLNQDYFNKIIESNLDKKNPDLGSRISFWTGGNDDDCVAEISFNVGAYGEKPFNKNTCVIFLPKKDNGFYKNKNNRDELLKLIFQFWNSNRFLIDGELIKIEK